MNVFHIPSWYPHRCFPLEGGYVRELAVATAELRPDWNLAISRWDQGKGFISLGHIWKSPRCVWETLTHPTFSTHRLSDNLTEYVRPTPTWSHAFLGGNRESVLNANRRSFDHFAERVGRVDLLHAHVSFAGGWVARRLAGEKRVPYVVTEHMGPFPLPTYALPGGGLPEFIRGPLQDADARIAVSPSLAEDMQRHGLPSAVVVPNPVDERLYQLTQTSGSHFTFFTLCGMERVKAVDDLLHAIEAVVTRLPQQDRARLRFRIGGEGPMLKSLRRLAARLGIDDCVAWLGILTREEARHEFMHCDAFILTSRHESFGIVFVEAMACGKPVIATRSGGPEWIVEDSTGILVEPGDRSAIASAIGTMAEGRVAYDASSIRRTFERRFSRSAVVDGLEQVYRSAISGRGLQ